jgi:putative salt-induced outer membrane protein YdiY
MTRSLLTALLAAALWSTGVLRADTVTFKDGSVLQGKIAKVGGGKIVVETTIAGAVTADLAQVAGITSDAELNIALQSGSILVGTLKREGDRPVIVTQNGTMNITEDSITAIWHRGQPNPEVVAAQAGLRKWKYEASADLSGRTGNSERFAFAGGAKAILKGPEDQLMFYGRGQRAQTEGEVSAKEIVGGTDFERRIQKVHSWYVRNEFEYDEIEQLDLRTTVAGGYGYYFLNREDHELRGRLGLLYRHESYKVRDDNSTMGLDLGLHHMVKLQDWGRMVNDLTFTPSIEDFSNYRIYHESMLELPLQSSRMKLQLGVSNEYNAPTGDDIKNLDTYYFARLVLSWE